LIDFEHRRDAGTLNVAAAQAKINTVLGGLSVDDWIAANPSKTISSFGLINDTNFQRLTPDFTRARFFQGGFTKYKGMHVNLRGRHGNFKRFRDLMYNISYAWGRGESTNATERGEFLAGLFDN